MVENEFVGKAIRLGEGSIVVVIPAEIKNHFGLNPGDFVKMKFLDKSDGKLYQKVDGLAPDYNLIRLRKIMEEIDLQFSSETITEALHEALYLINKMSEKQRLHTDLRSVCAASLYVVCNNQSLPKKGNRVPFSQSTIALAFGITEVTIRNRQNDRWVRASSGLLVRK